MKLIKYIVLLFLLLPISAVAQQQPNTEIRAVWLTTSWGLDWPTQGTSVEQQKAELSSILNQLHELKLNTVFFQVRARGTTFYRSSIEPMSPYFNKGNNFDPLAYAIDECHKRGIECHAWMVTFPMGQERKPVSKKKQKEAASKYPSYYKLVNNKEWYMDPGDPRTHEHILSLVKEIVSKYDIDGIHFDYIRYPNNDRTFPDTDTYKKYGNGKNLYDWRRDNITSLVTTIYDTVKGMKRWVQVSSSPLGRYKVLSHVPRDGWTAYETVFQDAAHWLKIGKHDMLFPMMYYRNELFEPFLVDWIANSNDRPITPGLGVYQMLKSEKDWSLEDITKQMNYSRESKANGQAYFRAKNILDNVKGVKDSVRTFYPYPAKLPAMKWLDIVAPNSPINMQVYKKENSLHIEWQTPDNTEDMTYNVYFSNEEYIDLNNPKQMIASGLYSNQIVFPIATGNYGFYYAVTASDRYHNESIACFPAFFSHAENEQ